MKQLLLISFFCIAFFSLSTAQVTFQGTVTDQSTGEKLKDCVIQIDNQKAPYFTGSQGQFKVTLKEAGTYSVKISRTGYGDHVSDYEITSSSPVNISLIPIDLLEKVDGVSRVNFSDEAVVQATRASNTAPTTYTVVTKEEIQTENLGQDLPFILESQPSVIVSSDAGAGVGYTSMRIRGSDMSRINFTINGIPYNDAESQGVFLVNLPDFASSINNIQIQRGVGTSTNGAGAFGASVNISTLEKNAKPYASFASSVGSFSTFKNTLNLGSGLIKNHFTFDGRLSRITSDGYIDRASSDLWSYYLSGGYYDENTILKINHFSGKEITYQSWNGIDAATLETDRTFNSAGTDFGQTETPYDNEVDNYKQDHYQVLLSQNIGSLWNTNVGLHYTKGAGYFEQFKVNSSYASYNLPNPIIGNDTITSTDLIRRRWLDNQFYGITYSANYENKDKVALTIGGAWNQYDGDHFGEIIWAQNASTSSIRDRYYDNNGLKTDFNIFTKITLNVTDKLLLFGDIQYRNVAYNVSGVDNDQRYLFVDKEYNFVNPKVGLTYLLNRNTQVYSSLAIASREPTRNDFIDAIPGKDPLFETVTDFELGYRHRTEDFSFSTNYYKMSYDNQLVLTGALNDVGSLVRSNVLNSFRTGVESDLQINLMDIIDINTNVTWSVNEIKEFTESAPDGSEIAHDKTKIAYSPQWIGSFNFTIQPVKNFKIAFINKFIGKQFLDNTTNDARSLDKYTQNDIQLSYRTNTKILKDFELSLLINNYTNRLYESNGYVYFGEAYFYPQAGANFLLGMRTSF